jgi:hypothetical protein
VRVELLVIPDCPNHPPALERLREVLTEEGVESDIEEIVVNDETTARRLNFLGSPTIRINGHDVEPSNGSQSCAASCRMYASSRGLAGIPSAEVIRKAIREG